MGVRGIFLDLDTQLQTISRLTLFAILRGAGAQYRSHRVGDPTLFPMIRPISSGSTLSSRTIMEALLPLQLGPARSYTTARHLER